ncbi:MAG TPA: TonB-dependent receptor [Xanthomonadales bacterium]|nr:TonB-dependent receptor [Xanthomonadales bacterium]
MVKMKRNMLFLALAATGFCVASTGFAQDQASTDEAKAKEEADAKRLDQIEVRGFRQAVETSIAEKRDNTSIVEVVSAEDIGKLPDVSIGEAIARLPGLTAQRVDGRAQVISVRGLGPDFSTALLNGREQVTTGDNRGVEFDQYPAELLGSVVVYKTPDSTLIGQGLAGTVDLRTIRPLAHGRQSFSVNARYEFNEDGALNPDGTSDGYRASATYIDQFNDDTVGITLGIAAQSTPNNAERFNAWGFPTAGDGGPFVIGGAKPFAASNDLDRIGFIGTLEYKPSDTFHTTLDIGYSDFEETQQLRGIEFPLFWNVGAPRAGFTVEDGLITEGVFDNVKGVMRNDLNEREAELFNLGWNTRFEFGNNWGFETDLSYSRSDRSDELLESYLGTGPAGVGATDSLGFRIEPNGNVVFSPTLDYSDITRFLITDPQGWGGGAGVTQAGFINAPETEDELTHIRLSLDREFMDGAISKVTVGIDGSRRDKDREIFQDFLVPQGGANATNAATPIPIEALLNRQVDLSFMGIPGHITLDPLFLLENGFLTRVPISLSSFNVPQNWKVREDVFVGFVKADLDTTFAGLPVTGNIGLQVVNTDQTSTGFRVRGDAEIITGDPNSGFIEVIDGDDYTKFLPSLNLIFELDADTKLRFGAARTLARARMDQLNAGLTLGVSFAQLESTDPNRAFFSASGGNAQLRPTISNNVDLSIEHYFGDGGGYVALAGFYKDLQDFINPNDARLFDFSDFVDDFLTPEQQADLGTTLGIASGPSNRGKGNIKGVEFTASVPLNLVSDVLDGFGVISSVSYTDSKVLLGDSTVPISVPGLSTWVVNTTLYFERDGFSARVGHRYRDEFLSEIFGLSATRVTREAKSETVFDAQVSYEFQSGRLKGLTLLGQANNLTDEPFTTFEQGNSRLVIDRQEFGRTFLFGASYRF